jgi:group I intron endonuclease
LIIPTYGGIYKIVNIKNGKIYVGSTVNFKCRWRNHLSALVKGTHESYHLQNAFNKYRREFFIFLIEEVIKIENKKELKIELKKKEQYWVDHYKSNNEKYGYNIRIIIESNLGIKHRKESKAKMSESSKNRWKNDLGIKDIISKAGKKKWANPEFREKRSKEVKSQWSNPEFRDRMVESNRNNWSDPKIRESIISGQKENRCSLEYRTSISKKLKSLWANPEFRDRMIKVIKIGRRKRKEEVEMKSKNLICLPQFGV